MTHEQTKNELLICRSPGADKAMQFVQWVEDSEREAEVRTMVQQQTATCEANLRRFRSTPVVDKWLLDYTDENRGRRLRYQPLLLCGPTRTGKTQRAVALFGRARTLVVNCQGCGNYLPSLKAFRRTEHVAVVFDEISPGQVLANKVLFQSGPEAVTLGQSACNQHAYQFFGHGVAMIFCSNHFDPDSEDLTVEDRGWLLENIVNASLPLNSTWYT